MELLTWARSLDEELASVRGGSITARKTATLLIEMAYGDCDREQHRGGHRHGARSPLLPWEAEREAYISGLVASSLARTRARLAA